MPPKRKMRSGLTGTKATAVFDLVLELKKLLLTFPNDKLETQEQIGAGDEAQAEADARAQEAEKVETEVSNIVERLEKILAAAVSPNVRVMSTNPILNFKQAIQFSSDHLHNVFNVRPETPDYFLSFKADGDCRVIASNTTHLGAQDFWSSGNMHAHLNYLLRTVPQMVCLSAISCFCAHSVLISPRLPLVFGSTLFSLERRPYCVKVP
jgi:hypothetical protein